MCKWGTHREITIERKVFVDECIADFAVWLNSVGIYTMGCCCGHFKIPTASFIILNSSSTRAEVLGFTIVHRATENKPGLLPELRVTHEEIELRLRAASVSGGIMVAALEATGQARAAASVGGRPTPESGK